MDSPYYPRTQQRVFREVLVRSILAWRLKKLNTDNHFVLGSYVRQYETEH